MKLRYQFIETEAPEGILAFTAGKDMEAFHGFLRMNPVGAAIFHALSVETSAEEIAEKLRELYPEQSEDTVVRAVREFTGRLLSAGLLE